MMNCRQISRLVSEGRDRKLSLRERFGMRIHLAVCSFCRSFLREVERLGLLANHVGRAEGQEEPSAPYPPGLSEQARRRMRQSMENDA